jgi:hypothetical protein
VVAATCALGLVARPMAWGTDGHRVVARIAQSLLTGPAKRSVNELLVARDLVSVSTWADEIVVQRPDTSRRHFVNIPVDYATYDPARDCDHTDEGDCVVAALTDAIRMLVLAKKGLIREPDRQEALKFLVHFVGDVHQPLNCADNQDRAGREVKVVVTGALTSLPADDLHAVWERGLIQSRGMSEEAYATYLLQGLTAPPVAQSALNAAAWAVECHDVAIRYAYRYAGFTAGSPPREPVILDAMYIKDAQAMIDRQLQLAGVRLAQILNLLFQDVSPSQSHGDMFSPIQSP